MKKATKSLASILLILVLSLGVFVGCSTGEKKKEGEKPKQEQQVKTKKFTDSVGREVEIPEKITKVAPSGALAQMIIYSLSPDKVIGWSNEPSDLVKKYMDEKYWKLPTFGQFYGKNVSLNMEALVSAKPDVIIDIGEKKKTIKEDMDGIQEQTGIPVIFIEATLDTMSDAYKTLGELLSEEEAAKALSEYCAKAVKDAKEKSAKIPEDKRLKVYYGEGDSGLQTNPKGSVHADVIDMVAGINVADIPKTSGSGGNEVSAEQVILWNPDVIILGPKSIYGTIGNNDSFKKLDAVKNGKYYEIPNGPYNWMGRPPSINRLMGVKWLGNLLYPETFNYDMIKETKEFYKLFYHYDIKDDEVKQLLGKSTYK